MSIYFAFSVWAFLLTLPSRAVGQLPAPPLCPLQEQQSLAPFQNEVRGSGSTKFKWYSAASTNPNSSAGHPSHAFERRVTNTGKGALKYDWPVVRMHNIGLPENAPPDSTCVEAGYPNQADGPLFYGRGSDSTPTTVWVGKDEPKAPSVLGGELAFTVIDGEAFRRVTIAIQSSVSNEPNGRFRYSYAIQNTGRTPVRINWHVAEVADFAAALRAKDLSMPQLLTADRVESIVFVSASAPVVENGDLEIIDGNQANLAGVGMPTLLPRTGAAPQ